ncbi:MAG: class I SAM-dependent DNA methyltransferase [Prosthecobacter sp.]|uniref:class I SAM-dependent DNA methyltransferase n=1 Tax=Prosthecobacter sp. TaxID=1965333 RepID=UPI001A067AEE|nr:DNA methyltransferase [Prosthecobacter sp.]MBE2281893.1 class I SAM-dependent DNA methyltransferase [Prosthecobacter sp.]
MTSAEAKTLLPPFLDFVKTLQGDEKSEAQIFLDRLFRALGHDGAKEAGATFEYRVAKKPGSSQLSLFSGDDLASAPKLKGGVKFADLLWPGRVLIEMKSRGEKLEKHYDQLFYYWSHIVPKRPPFAILCNFDELWIYDFNEQLFDPVDRIRISELPKRYLSLGFLFRHQVEPLFENNRVTVTRNAADHLAHVFRSLIADRPVNERIERARAQRFILQMLVSYVSEDLNLLPNQIVTQLLDECLRKEANSYDVFGGLFQQMNNTVKADGGRFKGVPYFNGGLFSKVDPIELKQGELERLRRAADQDWSQVRPEIFGTLFQHSMDAGERHAYGAHFTSEVDINKVIEPTIARPWRERIDACGKHRNKLRECLKQLRLYRVLDPACGSGNFLYLAYRVLKRLERDILLRLREAGEPHDNLVSAVTPLQLFGMDVLPTAVEIARVTLTLAKELEVLEAEKLSDADGLYLPESPLPLDNLDKQIQCADALFTEWPKADAIIGNPPYLGSRRIPLDLGYDYANKLYGRFSDVPKMADFCSHWFRLAHDTLPEGGRAGLVGTNSIRQNETREASLDYIVENGGTITEAVSTQVWSGEAAVHVSIVNWTKNPADGGADKGAEPATLIFQLGDSVDSPWETFEIPSIGPSLSIGPDMGSAIVLSANENAKACFTGQNPVNAGFFITHGEASSMIHADPRNKEVIFPYMIGRDMLEAGGPTRSIIDFAKRDQFEARSYDLPWKRLEAHVKDSVLARAVEEQKATGKEVTRYTRIAERWWQFYDYRPGTIAAINSVPRYVAVSRVTKRPIFEFVSSAIHADTALVVFPMADDYSFGILQCGIHFAWFKARCSSLKGDFRYTSDTVFDTFPWPQEPTPKQMRAVADAAVALRQLRRDTMDKLGWSLRDLYRSLEQPGANPLRDAHAALDAAVRAAYGMGKNDDILTHLLALNHACAEKEKAGQKITPPGLPLPPEEHAAFITADCITAPIV